MSQKSKAKERLRGFLTVLALVVSLIFLAYSITAIQGESTWNLSESVGDLSITIYSEGDTKVAKWDNGTVLIASENVTKVLQRAIDSVHNNGGGKVLVRPGDYNFSTPFGLILRDNVLLKSVKKHEAVFRLVDGATNRFCFVKKPVHGHADNSGVVGFRMECNSDNQPSIESYLTRNARIGDNKVYVENASKFSNQRHIVIRDENNIEKYRRIVDVNTSENSITFENSLNHDFNVENKAKLVRYPNIRAVGLSNSEFVLIEGNLVLDPRGGRIVQVGNDDFQGPKVIQDNVVKGIIHSGGVIRAVGTQNAKLINNTVMDGRYTSYGNAFWLEALSLEGSVDSSCINNSVYNFTGRLIRAPRIQENTVISGNVLKVPLTRVSSFEGTSQGVFITDEQRFVTEDSTPTYLTEDTITSTSESSDTEWTAANSSLSLSNDHKEGESSLEVTARNGFPGIKKNIEGDWSDYNRGHIWVKGITNETATDIRLRVEDSNGSYEYFDAQLKYFGEWELLSWDFNNPSGSSGSLDWSNIEKVKITARTDTENYGFKVDDFVLGRKTSFGITMFDSHNSIVKDNVLIGIGSPRGSLYYRESSNLTISNNQVIKCYEGIGDGETPHSNISNNLVYGVATEGIAATEATITNNNVSFSNSWGIAGGSLIADNYVYKSGALAPFSNSIVAGNEIIRGGVYSGKSNITVTDNKIVGINTGWGITLRSAGEASPNWTVTNNTIISFETGIKVAGGENAVIQNNTIKDCIKEIEWS